MGLYPLLCGDPMKKTIVINLFAGSGAGKSTTAAALYAAMKLRGYHVELVREYIKEWAWAGRKPDRYDQIYIMGKQIHAESPLYHKVDYIITDSPFLLSPFYEQHNFPDAADRLPCKKAAFAFKRWAEQNDIEYINFFLVRKKKFDPRGRYETEEQAIQIDDELAKWLNSNNVPFDYIDVSDKQRVRTILKEIKRYARKH